MRCPECGTIADPLDTDGKANVNYQPDSWICPKCGHQW